MTTDPITVNAGRCTWETIDDETMVIDTLTGELFALRGLAAPVWDSLVGRQASAASLAAEAGARYGGTAAAELGAVLDELTRAQLLASSDIDAAAVPAWPARYEAATLDRFDDIADILTLDPIHDVDPEEGWPFEQPDSTP